MAEIFTNLKSNSPIWGYGDKLEISPLLAPFKSITSKTVPKGTFELWNGKLNSAQATVSKSIVKAMTFYCMSIIKDSLGPDLTDLRLLPKHLAIGEKASDTEEDSYYCEFKDSDPDGKSPNELQVFKYNPSDGIIEACVIDEITHSTNEYVIHKGSHIHDGTGLWLCVLPYMEKNSPYLSDKISKYKEYLFSLSTEKAEPDDMLVFTKTVVPACLCIYKNITGEPEEADFPLKIMVNEIASYGKKGEPNLENVPQFYLDLSDGPSKGKNITGEFRVLGEEPTGDTSHESVPKEIRFSVDWHKPFCDFTENEKALIPKEIPGRVITKEYSDIVEAFNSTFGIGKRSLEVTQFLIKGGTGVGKSCISRQFAMDAKRPYVSQQFSANTTEDDLKGMLLPYTVDFEGLNEKETEVMKAVAEATDDDVINPVAIALGLPTELDCDLNPEESFRTITGITAKASSSDAYNALCKRIMADTVSILNRAQSDTGVKYKYIPSNIVRAIENGWVLELQEVNAVNQASVLHCIFDVLEKESLGVLSTIKGDIYRHPDFVCFATMNEGYAGTHELNDAFVNRFDYIEDMGTLKPDKVESLIYESGIFHTKKDCKKISEIHQRIMDFVKEEGLNKEISIRNLLHFAQAIKMKKDPVEACDHYLLNYIASKESDCDTYQLLMNAVKDCTVLKG